MKKIKILMVAGNMHIGGIENQLMHLMRNVDKEKFQIDFTSTMRNPACREEIEQLGGKIYLIPKMNWKKPVPYCKEMYHIMKSGHYDVVHSHELFHSGITLLLARWAGVPCRFAHAHNWSDGDGTGRKRSILRSVYNCVMRKLLCYCSTVQIACSSWAGEFVFGKNIAKKSSYHVIFNSIDTAQFLDDYDNLETGEYLEQNGWKNVLNIARITAVKNQIFLTKIAKVFKERGAKIRILCVGTGDEGILQQVRENIKKYQIEDYFFLVGVRKDIPSLMRKSSAFVLPSKYEGMPLVMIEAQASGLTCVSADTYSPEVDFGINTVIWLSLEEGPAVWADALEKAVMRKRADKEEVVKAVLDKKFDSKMFANELCNLYKEDYQLRGKKK